MRSGYLLMANTVLTGLTGLLYWAIAARVLSQGEMGAAATVITLIMLLSNIGQINLSYSLPVLLPRAGDGRRRLLMRGLALASGMTLFVSVGYFLFLGSRLPLDLSLPLVLFLILCAQLWTVFVLEDGALVGLRTTWLVPVSNTIFGVLKIAMLAVLIAEVPVGQGQTDVLMIGSWFLPLVVIVPFVVAVMWRRSAPTGSGEPARLPDLKRFLAWDYVGGIFYQVGLSMSYFVGVTLGPEAAAAFVAAWTLAQIADLATNNLASPMGVAVADARQPGRTHAEVEVGKRLLVLIPLGVTFTIAAAPYLLLLFGQGYADEATGILRLLMIALLFKAAATYSMWGLRARNQARTVASIQIVLAIMTVSVGLLLAPSAGPSSFAIGFIVGSFAAGGLGLFRLRSAWQRDD